jgi:hypothetical protein
LNVDFMSSVEHLSYQCIPAHSNLALVPCFQAGRS